MTEQQTTVSDLDQSVYRGIAAYAFDEAEAWPSQQRIADDLGIARETVNRSIQRLIRAGWMIVSEKRWGTRLRQGRRWRHNVYELLAPYAVSALSAKRITRRAHNTLRARARRAMARAGRGHSQRLDHTKRGVQPGGGAGAWCACRHCMPERTSIVRPPPPVTAPAAYERIERSLRAKFGTEEAHRLLAWWGRPLPIGG